MLIRLATRADLDALAELAAATFPLACPPDLPDADQQEFIATNLSAEQFGTHLASPEAEVLVAEAAGKLTGYTLTFDREPYDPLIAKLVTNRPTVELSKCYADPSAHGTGTAGELMTAVLDRAKNRAAASVWLGVNGQNERAQRFYAKHGFAVIGARQFQVGDRIEDDLVLELVL